MRDFLEDLVETIKFGLITILIIYFIIPTALVVSLKIDLSSPNSKDDPSIGKEFVSNDFVCKMAYFYDLDETGTVKPERTKHKGVRIMGLSEEGKQKEVVIIPKYIDEVIVEALGVGITHSGVIGEWEENEILKKVYFPYPLDTTLVFSKCKNLNRIIFNWHYSDRYIGDNPVYVSSYHYNSEKDVTNCFKDGGSGYVHFANVSYFYNYDNAPNDNYYWIDDYDYGEKIDVIPPVPTRAGYTFGGWYKESECINKWNFEIDTLPTVRYTDVIPEHQLRNSSVIDNDYRVYQETKLYAKWI